MVIPRHRLPSATSHFQHNHRPVKSHHSVPWACLHQRNILLALRHLNRFHCELLRLMQMIAGHRWNYLHCFPKIGPHDDFCTLQEPYIFRCCFILYLVNEFFPLQKLQKHCRDHLFSRNNCQATSLLETRLSFCGAKAEYNTTSPDFPDSLRHRTKDTPRDPMTAGRQVVSRDIQPNK